MKTKTSVLSSSLADLRKGGETWQAIEKKSGVFNIKRIKDGNITPTIESWWKIHKAYPLDVPPPVLIDPDGHDYTIVNGDASGNRNSVVNVSYKKEGTSQEKYFWSLFEKHGNNELLDEFIAIILERKIQK